MFSILFAALGSLRMVATALLLLPLPPEDADEEETLCPCSPSPALRFGSSAAAASEADFAASVEGKRRTGAALMTGPEEAEAVERS